MAYTQWGLSLLGMRKWRKAQRNRKLRRAGELLQKATVERKRNVQKMHMGAQLVKKAKGGISGRVRTADEQRIIHKAIALGVRISEVVRMQAEERDLRKAS